jgi:putative endonuclease
MSGRQRAWRRGRRGEALARLRLILSGWRIVARNLREPAGEIDLVARRGRTIAFIEVKSRDEHGAALEAVRLRQQRRIARAAQGFLARRPDLAALQPRFDVIAVTGIWPRHIVNAWTAEQ